MTHQAPTAHAAALATTRTPQEAALIAIHAQRAAELRIQRDLIVARSLKRDAEEQKA